MRMRCFCWFLMVARVTKGWAQEEGLRLQGQGKARGDVEKSCSSSKYVLADRFREPVHDDLIDSLCGKTFVASTDRKIAWAVKLFEECRMARMCCLNCPTEVKWSDLSNPGLSQGNLQFSLCRFITEVKRLDGSEFPGRTLYNIVLLIQFYLEKSGLMWHLLSDDGGFVKVKCTLDNVMKAWAKAGICPKVSSKPIELSEEDKMWKSGVLGEHDPVTLRNTVQYLVGLAFALRGGEEHRALRAPKFDPQITVGTTADGVKFLKYTQDECTKTNQGGLKSRKSVRKEVVMYGNSDFDRDLVRLYKKYISLLPSRS